MKKIYMIGVLLIFLLAGCSQKPLEPELIKEDDCFQYYGQKLSAEEQNDYGRIYDGLIQHMEYMILESEDSENIIALYEAVLNDHPEIFYVKSGSRSIGEIKKLGSYQVLYPEYEYTEDEIKELKTELLQKKQMILSGIDPNASDYDKSQYVYDYIIDHTTYDENARDNQNILSVMLYGSSVCSGYAKTAQYLLHELKIPAAYIVGRNLIEVSILKHAWNMVQLDGELYYMDATWGDQEKNDFKAYAYLNMNSEEMLKTYTPDHYYEETSALQDNYYVKHGRYLEVYDEQRITELVQEAQAQGNNVIEFKSANEEIFEEMKTNLIENQRFFAILRQIGVYQREINYTYFKEQYVMRITF